MNENSNRYKLLQEDLGDFFTFGGKGITDRLFRKLNKFFSKNQLVQYKILIPKKDSWRVELICEDINILGNGYQFTQTDLLEILFEDFLKNIRLMPNHHSIYKHLKMMDCRPPSIYHYGKEYLYEVTEEFELRTFFVKKRSALRVEIFLSELADLYPETPYSVEDVIEIMYCDFVKGYTSGELQDVVERIMKHLELETP